ncbi:MAG: filamentous hemagglutinin N-terminal domain-containing protein [Cyanobacteria bacterium P01_F01_bin.150]
MNSFAWAACIIGVSGGFDSSAQAQIIPDQTLGQESSIVVPDRIQGLDSSRIDGGATRANILFHSFSDFNIASGQGAYFSNPSGVDNILSRVTGNTPSDVMGRLGVLGNANLFLLNPNGILFGPQASLDISGSFVASTAKRFTFANGMTFDAVEPNAAPLLTLNISPGLQYGDFSSGANGANGAIATQGRLTAGHNLTLSSDHLKLQGQLSAGNNLRLHGRDTVTIRDTVTTPFIAAAGQSLKIQGNQNIDIFALNHPDSGIWTGGDLTLRSAGAVIGDAHYWSGGNFRIEQLDGTLASWASPNDPVIRATGDVTFDSYEGASLHILAGGSITVPGTIEITDVDETNGIIETVTLSDGATIDIDGTTIPTLDIRAGVTVTETQVPAVDGEEPGITGTGIFTPEFPSTITTATSADISIGEILNQTGDVDNGGIVLLTNQYRANDALQGDIEVGIIDVTGGLIIDSRGDITATGPDVEINSDGGEIRLMAGDRIQFDQVDINSEGGKIGLFADNQLVYTNGNINSGTFDEIAEDSEFNDFSTDLPGSITLSAGNISISSTKITADGGGAVETDDAVDVNIEATADDINIDSQSIISSSAFSQGFAGRINLDAPSGSIVILNSSLSSSFEGSGNNADTVDFTGEGGAGIISLHARDNIRIRNQAISDEGPSRINLNAETTGVSESSVRSNIALDTTEGSIFIRNGAISTTAEDSGFAGNITLESGDRIRLRNTVLSSNSEGTFSEDGGSGQIKAESTNTIRLIESQIRAGSVSNDDAEDDSGSITFTSTDGNVILQNSRLDTNNAGSGFAGEITIDAQQGNIQLIGNQDLGNEGIFADTPAGDAGDINLFANEVFVQSGSRIAARTETGAGGNILILANDDPNQDSRRPLERLIVDGENSRITARATQNEGVAGVIAIEAQNITVSNQASITAANVSSDESLDSIRLENVETLTLITGGQVSARTDTGSAGNIGVNKNGEPVESLIITGESSRITARARMEEGEAGRIIINAETIQISDRGLITAANVSGSAIANLNSSVRFNNVSTLQVFDGGTISSETQTGEAGNIQINSNQDAAELIRVRGEESGITAIASEEGGQAGNVTLNTQILQVEDGSEVSVSSLQGNAGTLRIIAPLIQLNDGRLVAEIGETTGQNEGGNIRLENLFLLLMEDNSLVSAQAFDDANGGNLTVNSIATAGGFMAARPNSNSDVLATADQGIGGQINIFVDQLFGFKIQENTLNLLNNTTNDLSASSAGGPQGIVKVETLAIDPSLNLGRLPIVLVDVPPIAGLCSPRRQGSSEFIQIGRGGLPQHPDDARGPGRSPIPWVTRPTTAPNSPTPQLPNSPTPQLPNSQFPIIETQGWTTDQHGNIVLTAQIPAQAHPDSSAAIAPNFCPL